jgi:hypothetical protein
MLTKVEFLNDQEIAGFRTAVWDSSWPAHAGWQASIEGNFVVLTNVRGKLLVPLSGVRSITDVEPALEKRGPGRPKKGTGL